MSKKDQIHTDFKKSNNYSFQFNTIFEKFYNIFFKGKISSIEVVVDEKR